MFEVLLGSAIAVVLLVVLAVVVIAFIKRETITVASPHGELKAPTDAELRKTRDDHPPGEITPTKIIGCHWCMREAIWRDMVTFACDVHRSRLWQGGKRAHRVMIDLGDGVKQVGDAILHPGHDAGQHKNP